MVKKMKNRELVIIPSIIIFIGLFLYLIGDTVSSSFFKILLPQGNSIFEFLKIYFAAFLLIYISGIFTSDKQTNNHLFSRVIGSIIMMGVTVLLGSLGYLVFGETTSFMLLVIFVVSTWIGQGAVYLLQTYNFKHGIIIALILQTLIALLISYYTFFPLENYLFI